MVANCIVCKYYPGKKTTIQNEQISLHIFPKDNVAKQKWIEAMGLTNIANSSRICSTHFSDTDFEEQLVPGSKRMLKKNAVPSLKENPLYINKTKNIQGEEAHVSIDVEKALLERRNLKKDAVPSVNENPRDINKTKMIQQGEKDHVPMDVGKPLLERRKLKKDAVPSVNENSRHVNKTNSIQQGEKPHVSIDVGKPLLERPNDTRNYEDVPCPKYRRIGDIDVEKVCTSPAEAKLCLEVTIETIKEQRTKIRKLETSNNKLQKSILDLKELLNDLMEKNLLSSEACDILESNAYPVVTSLVQKMLCQKNTLNQFSPELRDFAATLYFCSPTAYDFVRLSLMNILPHPSTIRKWYTSVNSDPGTSEIACETPEDEVSSAEEEDQ